MFTRSFANNRGASLLEVLIALFLTGIITAAVFQTYITQHQNYLVQDDITEIQQNARAAVDELTRQIRMAGYALPAGLPSIVASNTNPDTITICYRDDACNTFLSEAMPQPSSELKCGTDVSCFHEGEWLYIYETDSGKGEFFTVTEVQTGSLNLQHNTMSLSRKYGQKSLVLTVNSLKFYVDKTTDPSHPCLMVKTLNQATPQVYAENISDLQFQYRLANGNIVDVPTAVSDVRQVLIHVVARSNTPTRDKQGVDTFRTRTFDSEVYLRNLDT